MIQEGQESVITLKATTDDECSGDVSADDPKAVELMLGFLYMHDYHTPSVSISIQDAHGGNPQFCFGRPAKSSPPNAEFPINLPFGSGNTVMHAKLYALGAKYSIESLKRTALEKFTKAANCAWDHSDFIRAVEIVFTSTADEDKGLRDIVVQTVLDHATELSKKKDMERCICAIDGLAYDLWKAKPKKPDMNGPTCNVCGASKVALCATPKCGHYVSCDCDKGVFYCKKCRR